MSHRVAYAAIVVLLACTFGQSYAGRRQLVDSQRAGCQRGRLDRSANSHGWWVAEQARMDTATDPTSAPRARASARHAAELYAQLAAELEARASIDCHRAFPAASPLP